MSKHEVLRTNKEGIQLVDCGTYWSILKPIDPLTNSGRINTVYHVGQEKYVKGRWNSDFCKNYGRDPIYGFKTHKYGDVDNSLKV